MKLLIVDDNKYVVEGLKRQLNWSILGIEEIFGCYRVEQAKEILSSEQIDFLISDIEMPGHNGFKLLEWIREQGMELETVLLTSYADFEYAQLAVSYQCFQYLLKPVETGKLEEVICHMVEKHMAHQKEKCLAEYGNEWLSRYGIVKEIFWKDVLEETLPGNQDFMLQRIHKDHLSYEITESFTVALICYEPEQNGWSRELLAFSTENVICELTEKSGIDMEAFLVDGYLQFAIVLRSSEDQNKKTVEILKQFIDIFSQLYHSGIYVYLGKSSAVPDLAGHLRRLEEIHLAHLNRENGVLLENEYKDKQDYCYRAPEIREWKDLLVGGRMAQLQKRIREYFEQMKSAEVINYNQLQAVLADWNLLVYGVLWENNITTYQFITHVRDQELLVMAVRSVNCMENLILTEAEAITRQINYMEKTDAFIADIRQYIEEHLDEVSRSRISEVFYLSPNYLSRLFRKETGISLSEYIQTERMNRAKHLLLQSKLSISQIAAETGYPSFAHFSKQFKKFVGMTPGEYRKQK